ncbi:MAG: hypothetical protein ABW252_22040 [Polyangiales bacterium]
MSSNHRTAPSFEGAPEHLPALSRSGALARPALFWVALFALVAAGLARSWIATSHDSLQIDEAWHAVAGISYARTGDYRLNPEHPPLVKLWVGATMPESTFTLPPFRVMADKPGEREYIDDAFYIDNDPRATQAQMRLSMLAFHGLALLALGWALMRVVGGALALASIAVLLVDPTVAAHMPVVLTDLPLTLLAALAMLLAIPAFRSWRARDLALLAGALGLALVSKHSALPVGIAVPAFGGIAALASARDVPRATVMRRLGAVLAVGAGAYVVMWAFYGFRFAESPSAAADAVTFNRPIAEKIADLNSGGYRTLIQLALDYHLLPRAYLWGLADIVRAGVEGRQDVMYVFGKLVFGDTPWYFFPAVILAKLPLGTLALSLAGVVLLVRRRVAPEVRFVAWVLIAWGAFYLVFVMRGNSGYAGIRHAAPVVPTFALLAALPIVSALRGGTRVARGATVLAAVAACVSALPVLRPWEFYNELSGGTDGAWRYWADDGTENGQRTKELAAYYDAHVRGSDEVAYDFYDLYDNEKKFYRLDKLLRADDEPPERPDTVTGTVFVNRRLMGARPLYDYAAFREATPVARFGNLLVLHGTFRVPWLAASRRLIAAQQLLDAQPRDEDRAEKLLEEAVAIYPQDFQLSFELGNLLLERGKVDGAIRAYALARDHVPPGDALGKVLTAQIDVLHTAGTARPLRDPWAE